MVRTDLEALSFISRTASTGSRATSWVFAQARGSLNVVEKTTFDMPARTSVPGSPSGGESRHDAVSRCAHQDRVVGFGLFSQPREVIGSFQPPPARPALGGRVTIE